MYVTTSSIFILDNENINQRNDCDFVLSGKGTFFLLFTGLYSQGL